MRLLRQSTASQEQIIGPFVDDTDFKTRETGLTIANTDIKLIKGGSTSEVNKNSGGGTHTAQGRYSIVFDATDTNTLGSLFLAVDVAGALPVWHEFEVIAAEAYDSLQGSGNGLRANAVQVGSQTASAAGAVTFPDTIASTTNITAGTITTTTNLTNLPSIPTNWLTAAGIAASALNGKGDWNIGKTGYALTATTGLGNQTANITGNLSGSVGSVTGAVGSVTGAVGSVTAGVTLANGAHGGAAATLTLLSAAITNTAGNALTLTSSGSNGHGLSLQGHGTGAGMQSVGGATGVGVRAVGGATSGAGFIIQAQAGNTDGFQSFGSGTGDGAYFSGGASGDGLHVTGGGTTGVGLRAVALAANNDGIVGTGAGSGAGLLATGGINGNVTGNLSGSVGSVTGAVGSVTAAITLPSIPTNWITAGGINAAALNGKGDWNVGKTGYALTQAFPTNFASLVISAGGVVDSNVAQILGTGASTATIRSNVISYGGSAGTFSGGRPEVNVTHAAGTAWGSGAITAGAIAADAIGASELAADAVTEIATGVWAAATRTLSAGTNIALAKGTGITGFNDLDAAGVATAVWNAATATYGSAGSYGLLIETNLDAQVSTVGGGSLTEAGIADAVWDEVLSGHLTAGSTGNALNAAGSAGDPWTTTLPGAYTGSQAGKIIADILVDTGTTLQAELDGIQADTEDIQARIPATLVSGRIDASVGAMAANTLTATAIAADAITAAKVAADVGTEIGTAVWATTTRILTAGTNIALAKGTGVTGFNDLSSAGVASAVWSEAQSGYSTAGTFGYHVDTRISTRSSLDAAGVRTAVGLASANLDTQLTAIDDYLDTEVAAIKAKTDNLPAAPAATGDIPTTAQIADKVLSRNLAGGSDGGRTVQDALRFSRNRWTLSAGVLTVYAENDSTVAWTSAVTTNAAADPVTGSDPT
jgi:hypothetical protein